MILFFEFLKLSTNCEFVNLRVIVVVLARSFPIHHADLALVVLDDLLDGLVGFSAVWALVLSELDDSSAGWEIERISHLRHAPTKWY